MAVLLGSIGSTNKKVLNSFSTIFNFLNTLHYIKTKQHKDPNHAEGKKRISEKLNIPQNASYGSYAYELYNKITEDFSREQLSKYKIILKDYDVVLDNKRRIIKRK